MASESNGSTARSTIDWTRHTLLAGTAIMVAATAQPGVAQPLPGDDPDQIIVTARKRAEDIQSVPETIKAFTTEQIGFTDVSDLQVAITNFQVQETQQPASCGGGPALSPGRRPFIPFAHQILPLCRFTPAFEGAICRLTEVSHMIVSHDSNLWKLVQAALGPTRAAAMTTTLAIDPALAAPARDRVDAAELAMALNILLFADLLDRAPSGAAYVAERVGARERILFDHGALRTIRFATGPTGALPAGTDAFSRLLAPLGYVHARAYPLPALRMTGHAWCHRDWPEAIPQFFVSELHVDRFSSSFQDAAKRVFGTSVDPVDAEAQALLDILSAGRSLTLTEAARLLPVLAAAFGRHHAPFALSDYEALLAESAEAAWIATEGNAFNHATDRVDDVEALSDRLRAEGKPIKPRVEFSASGRVRQTALRADPVERAFLEDGAMVSRAVPGSFYEFITRDADPATGSLDLAFDSSNAQGIFTMTRAA